MIGKFFVAPNYWLTDFADYFTARTTKLRWHALARIIHATRKSNDRVSIEVEPCRSEGISAKGFIVMLGARQTV